MVHLPKDTHTGGPFILQGGGVCNGENVAAGEHPHVISGQKKKLAIPDCAFHARRHISIKAPRRFVAQMPTMRFFIGLKRLAGIQDH